MMSAPSATNVTPFPAPGTPAWKLGLDEVVMYCVGRPGCMELAAAVADPETKRYLLGCESRRGCIFAAEDARAGGFGHPVRSEAFTQVGVGRI